MFTLKDLKIKSKISVIFVAIIILQIAMFSLLYKGIIGESKNNIVLALAFSIVVIIALGLFLVNLVSKPMIELSHSAKKIVNGDFDVYVGIETKDELGDLANSLKSIINNINNIDKDTKLIKDKVVNGELNISLDNSKYKGQWKNISENNSIYTDVFIKNIRITSNYIDKISKGNIASNYIEEARGEFNVTKSNINELIKSLSDFETDVHWLKETFKLGNTRDKIDVSKFKGIYKEMAQSINDSMWISIDIFIKLFAVLKAYSEGEFSVELEKFAGRYGLVNENMGTLRGNLLNISLEQIKLANEIKAGDLSKKQMHLSSKVLGLK